MPRVSIGLPVYNGANFLEEALSALCRQSFGDFELIVSDNASTDRTGEVCREFAARDPRIRYFRNDRNVGASRNYNRTWELSRGELFKWAAHDDLCAPTYLERCVESLDRHPEAVLSYPRTVIIDAHGERLKTYEDEMNLTQDRPAERLRRYLFRSAQECNAVFGVIRSAALAGTRRIDYFNASDRVLLAELILKGKLLEIDEELFFRREHPGTSMRANGNACQVAAWFDPSRKRRIVLPICRLYFEFARSVLRSDLQIGQQACCLALVAKHFWWQRQGWSSELYGLPRSLAQLLSPPGPGRR